MDESTLVIGGSTTALEKALTNAGSIFASFGKSVKTKLDEIADAGGVFSILGDKIAETFDGAAAVAEQTMARMGEAMKRFGQIASAAFAVASGGLSKVFSFVTSTVGTMAKILTAPFQVLKTVVTSIFSGIKSVISTVFGAVTGLVSGLMSRIKGVFTGVFQALSDLAPLYGASIAAGLAVGFSELGQDEKALARMEGLIKSTGGVAGFTSEQLQKMANSMAAASGSFGGDDFTSGLATLLQFKNVRGDVFTGVAKAAEDMAVATGGDLAGAMDKLGRSLDEPLKGVKLLRSEGIHFTEAEVKMVEAMLASGKVMEAQRAILGRVQETYKGNAAAMAGTFTGKVHQLTEALKDQWGAIAKSLTPALEAVIPYIIKGANWTQQMAENFGEVVKATVQWAQASTKVIKQWYDYAVKVFSDVSMWIIDRIADAFAFVQTAVQDLPGFFETVKAKIALVWEQISQSITGAWSTMNATVENGWALMVHKMKLAYMDFVGFVQKKAIDIAVATGAISKDQGKQQRKNVDTVQGFSKLEEERKFRSAKKATASGPSQEDTDRLAKLQAAYDKLAKGFGAKFGENLGKNKGAFDAIKKTLKAAIEGISGVEIDDPTDPKGKKSNTAFAFNKEGDEGGGKKGDFEDLMGLQKRIAGAAFKDPAATATQTQTNIIQSNFAEWKKQKAEERKIQERIAESNEAFNKKFDQSAATGETIG